MDPFAPPATNGQPCGVVQYQSGSRWLARARLTRTPVPGSRREATIPLDDCLRDGMLALLRAHDAACVPCEPADLIVLGAAAVCSLSLVVLGLVAMKGAVADITGVVMALPPSSDPDDEKDRKAFRDKAAKEYVWLLGWRCAPGFLIAASGVGWLSAILWRVLFRTS